MITIRSKIVAKRDGQYTRIVFEDLNREPTDDLKYVTVVLLPNWNYGETLNIGETGYLQFESVSAGVTKWFDREIKDFKVYNYDANYFINFIKQKEMNYMKKEFNFD